jgi:hypothetical protein
LQQSTNVRRLVKLFFNLHLLSFSFKKWTNFYRFRLIFKLNFDLNSLRDISDDDFDDDIENRSNNILQKRSLHLAIVQKANQLGKFCQKVIP